MTGDILTINGVTFDRTLTRIIGGFAVFYFGLDGKYPIPVMIVGRPRVKIAHHEVYCMIHVIPGIYSPRAICVDRFGERASPSMAKPGESWREILDMAFEAGLDIESKKNLWSYAEIKQFFIDETESFIKQESK